MKSILLASVIGLLCLQSSFCTNKDKQDIQIDRNTGESLNKDRLENVTDEFCKSVFNFYILKKSLPSDLEDAIKENMSNAQNTIIELYNYIDNTCFSNCYGFFLKECKLSNRKISDDGQKIIADQLSLKNIDNLALQLKIFGHLRSLTPKFIDKIKQTQN